MDHAIHNKIVSFIWSIADDCLRDVFVCGKYRDVLLPMFVPRRIDCLLEDTREAVLAEVKLQKDDAKMAGADVHHGVIEKFVAPDINLSHHTPSTSTARR